MSIQTEINRLVTAKTNLKAAIENKGITVPNNTKLDGYSALVNQINEGGGGELATPVTLYLTNEGAMVSAIDFIIFQTQNSFFYCDSSFIDFSSGTQVESIIGGYVIVYGNIADTIDSTCLEPVEMNMTSTPGMYTTLIFKIKQSNDYNIRIEAGDPDVASISDTEALRIITGGEVI